MSKIFRKIKNKDLFHFFYLKFSVQLKSKLNYDDKTKSKASTNQIINSIKRVFRIILSLGYFQLEK